MPGPGRQKGKGTEPSQRQLRAGELIRHALVEILNRAEFRDPELQGIDVTIGEVRCSPDLRHASIFCSPLGKTDPQKIASVAAALNRASKYLRGMLGARIDMKFTPDLHFVPDTSYDEAQAIDALLRQPSVKRDLD